MKFSIRQILASTAGAVCAAVVASVFGVKGTIVGVAIGSAAATMATAFVAQSIERGHQAVKQVAVRAPETSTFLRRLGATDVSQPAASSVHVSSAPTEVVAQPASSGGSEAETVETVPAATQRPGATTAATPRAPVRRATPTGFSWKAIAASVAIVFVLALLLITAVELISGKPLSTIFGGADTGTTLHNLVNPPPAPTTTPTTTTSTTSTASTTSTTAVSSGSNSTTTSTTPPAGTASTTTPAPSTSTTTSTTGPALNATTTTTSTR